MNTDEDQQKPVPWTLKQSEQVCSELPGLMVYDFQRANDETMRCFAQTDLDVLYNKHPGLKKLVAKQMKQFQNAKTYFKTKPHENRPDFQACFSNNATNGKCLVPVKAVQESLKELHLENSVRRESISSFLSKMNQQEKEWVLQELAESVGVQLKLPTDDDAKMEPEVDTPLMTRAAARRTPQQIGDASASSEVQSPLQSFEDAEASPLTFESSLNSHLAHKRKRRMATTTTTGTPSATLLEPFGSFGSLTNANSEYGTFSFAEWGHNSLGLGSSADVESAVDDDIVDADQITVKLEPSGDNTLFGSAGLTHAEWFSFAQQPSNVPAAAPAYAPSFGGFFGLGGNGSSAPKFKAPKTKATALNTSNRMTRRTSTSGNNNTNNNNNTVNTVSPPSSHRRLSTPPPMQQLSSSPSEASFDVLQRDGSLLFGARAQPLPAQTSSSSASLGPARRAAALVNRWLEPSSEAASVDPRALRPERSYVPPPVHDPFTDCMDRDYEPARSSRRAQSVISKVLSPQNGTRALRGLSSRGKKF